MRILTSLSKRLLGSWLLGAVLLVGALAAAYAAARPKEEPLGRALKLLRTVFDTAAHEGLSDLTRGPDGTLYAIAERRREVLVLNPSGDTLVREVVRLEGVPTGTDTESLVALGNGRFVIGTERQVPRRAHDEVLFAERQGGAIVVRERRPLPFALFDLVAEANRGIEGLCAVGDTLLASLEQVKERAGVRLAPLARWDAEAQRWTPLYVRLTSRTGKLSALSCAAADDTLDVLAIERHYGVARLIRFAVPITGSTQVIDATVEANLFAGLDDTPNFEGLTRVGHELLLINDNSSGVVRGKSALRVFAFD